MSPWSSRCAGARRWIRSAVDPDAQRHVTAGICADTSDFGLDEIDRQRLLDVAKYVQYASIDNLLTAILPGSQAIAARHLVATYCSFAHSALLVFPEAVEGVLRLLRVLGFQGNDVLPSVVVRQRLAHRYGLDPDQLDVRLTHGAVIGSDGIKREIEVFMALEGSGLKAYMVNAERRYEFEQHLALMVSNPEVAVLEKLRAELRDVGGFLWDGGGYNPHEDPATGGRTVLYFAKPVGVGLDARLCRLELKAPGHFFSLIEEHHSHDEILSLLYERAGAEAQAQNKELRYSRLDGEGDSTRRHAG